MKITIDTENKDDLLMIRNILHTLSENVKTDYGELCFTKGTIQILKNNSILNKGDLLNKNEGQLISLNGAGNKFVSDLVLEVKSNGYDFKK